MKKILVCGAIVEAGMARLRAREDVEVEVIEEVLPDRERFRAAIADADGLIVRTAPCDADILEAAPKLAVVSRHGVGFDNVDVETCVRRGVAVAISADANASTVAEHAFALMLGLAKKLVKYDRATRSGDWAARGALDLIDLAGRNLLLIGCGRIGAQLARRARAFEMNVLAYDPHLPADALAAIGAEKVGRLEDGLGRADVISLHMPKTEATRGILDARALARLRPHALVINTARGGLIDEAALAGALERGAIAGAGIDVFEDEPPGSDHPLLAAPNVLLSPHLGGVTAQSMQRMAREAADNALAALDGRLDPRCCVNPSVLAS